MFYRLPFPNMSELEKLIKEAKGEASMIEFRQRLRAELDTPRAVQDFENGWEKYWQETQSQELRAAAGIDVEESFDERNRSPTPETPGSDREGHEGGGDTNSECRRALVYGIGTMAPLPAATPLLPSLCSPAFPS